MRLPDEPSRSGHPDEVHAPGTGAPGGALVVVLGEVEVVDAMGVEDRVADEPVESVVSSSVLPQPASTIAVTAINTTTQRVSARRPPARRVTVRSPRWIM
ncbi:hypothetical protein [Gordonia bronchialis]|uniref:hypothetical protein n=1 Tax=Gordonia bronchialis TaxID=2054 RepID=UPI00242A7AEE|nr:hypothetical protein [Gordonia bronchialis]